MMQFLFHFINFPFYGEFKIYERVLMMRSGNFFASGGNFFTTWMLFLPLSVFVQANVLSFYFTGTALKEDLGTYLLIKKYIEKNSKYHVKIKFARTYAEVILKIRDHKADIAYVCSSTYIKLKEENQAKLLAIPISGGSDQYYSYVIARKNTPYKTLLDFRDKIFSFTDPDSTSGAIAPSYEIRKRGYDPRSFFRKLVYTYDHGESIEAVLDGFVDGASVDSLVLEQYERKHPEEVKKIRVVEKFGPFTISPIVARSNLDPKDFKALQTLFLGMQSSELGREILHRLRLDGFSKPEEQDYKKIYTMLNYLKKTDE